MPSAVDLTLGARQKSNTERSKFVSDTEVLGYVNERLLSLRDLMIEADPSFYHSQADLIFNNPAGHPAGSASLPADLYRIRGLTQWPDTPNARSIRPLAFSSRDGAREAGYVLDGNCVTIVPYTEATRGPVRVYYTPVLQLLASPIPVTNLQPDVDGPITVTSGTDHTNAPGDYLFSAVPHGGITGQSIRTSGWANAVNNKTQARITAFNSFTTAITVADTDLVTETAPVGVTADLLLFNQQGGTWSALGFDDVQPQPGDTLIVSGSQYSDGSRTILTASRTSVTTDAAGLTTPETFGPNVSVTIQRAGTTPTLDVIMNPFAAYLTIGAAISIATKMQKDSLVALLSQQFAAEAARVSEMAANRAGETEAIPVLWRPETSSLNPWGWGGWGF